MHSLDPFLAFERTAILTGAGAIRGHRVTVQAVALVASIAVHAAVLAGSRFQAALVQICKQAMLFKHWGIFARRCPVVLCRLPTAYLDYTSFQRIRGSTCICWGRHTLRACSRARTELGKHLTWQNTSSNKRFEDAGLLPSHICRLQNTGVRLFNV